jgi:two-component system, NtrC family, response regulator AtoC
VEQARGRYNFGKVVTQNEATRRMLEVARKAAESDHTTILIEGKSGTGKSVFAKAIHDASPRSAMPLLELNCAALPETLLESELFGLEPGAFTDARRRKEGLLERADRGTLFIDEIATMSASVQAKLLKVLEDATFMRLGGTQPIKINVRLIAATNADLKGEVARGAFREDLYYRFNVVPLYLPPLRERREDIVPLALELVHTSTWNSRKISPASPPAPPSCCRTIPGPATSAKLKNVIERTMILASEGEIDTPALPEEIRDYAQPRSKERSTKAADSSPEVPANGRALISLRELEDNYIQEVLIATGNNKTQAARILGIHPTSLLRKLKKEQ